MAELRLITIGEPDVEKHWISNIVLNGKSFKLYRTKEKNSHLFICDRLKEQWYEIIHNAFLIL